MDKILQSTTNVNEITITNDGATILKKVASDNPAGLFFFIYFYKKNAYIYISDV